MADIGWTSVADAATFFATRLGCSAWATAEQIPLLTTAWNRIRFDPRWTIPAVPTADQKEKLAYAQYLTAWYMNVHLEDEDRRKGLQAQGVVSAGLVQESYDVNRLDSIPLPAEALGVLENLFTTAKPFYVVDIDRKEPVSAGVDTTETDDSLNTPGTY